MLLSFILSHMYYGHREGLKSTSAYQNFHLGVIWVVIGSILKESSEKGTVGGVCALGEEILCVVVHCLAIREARPLNF